jgi:hypothetical protein
MRKEIRRTESRLYTGPQKQVSIKRLQGIKKEALKRKPTLGFIIYSLFVEPSLSTDLEAHCKDSVSAGFFS